MLSELLRFQQVGRLASAIDLVGTVAKCAYFIEILFNFALLALRGIAIKVKIEVDKGTNCL